VWISQDGKKSQAKKNRKNLFDKSFNDFVKVKVGLMGNWMRLLDGLLIKNFSCVVGSIFLVGIF
jgi:hypothetical protein